MKGIIKIVATVMFIVVILNAGLLALMVTLDGSAELEKLEKAIATLNAEKEEMREKLEISQTEYYNISEKLRRVEEERAQYRMKTEKYTPIIKRASLYPDSNVSYLNMGFVETVFTISLQHNISPYIVFAVIDVESNYSSTARNKRSGAIGLGQIIKSTGEFIHYKLMNRTDKYVHESLLSAFLNVQYTIEYLSYLVSQRGSVDLALKQYCGGYVKGHENFYQNHYRKKIKNSLMSFGLSEVQAEDLLKSK